MTCLISPMAATSPLDPYLRTLRGDALLSAEEEKTLALAIARGDDAARQRLIRSNLRLVIKIAREYQNRGLPMDDLVGEGNLGLIRAVQDFDPAFGVRFSTYAAYWIKQSIRSALTNTAATIRLPSHMVNLLAKRRKAERSLRRELGREPSAEELADRLELSDAQRRMVDRAVCAGRLCHEGAAEGRGWSGAEVVDAAEGPGAALEAVEARDEVRRRLDRLDDRERLVVSLRFGLDDHPPLTLKEVGRRLGVTREWVRKIELRAVGKLVDDATPLGRSRRPA